MTRPWPVELRLNPAKDRLTVRFDDGSDTVLESEYLRVMTGSALDRGHGGGPRPPAPGKRGVKIAAITPVGRYAVRLAFDDGHDTGLYSWDLLHDLGVSRDKHWGDYIAGLKQAGLPRG
jgi:DUF971 family protein